MAEGVLAHVAELRGVALDIDSAGTSGYHIGEAPDRRGQATLSQFGLDISGQRSRQFVTADFDHFDHILVADQSNKRDVLALARTEQDAAKVHLMLHWSTPGAEVPDPYYGGDDGFDHVYTLLVEGCNAFLDTLHA